MNKADNTAFFLERMAAEPVLCLVSDRGYADRECPERLVSDCGYPQRGHFLDLIAEAVDAGVTMVQLRDKDGQVPLRRSLEDGRAIRALCAGRRIPFIVNDRLDLAMALDADGVHLGQGDLPLALARELWGEGRLYGLSVSNAVEAAERDASLASYLGAGAVFATTTKADATVAGEGELERIVTAAGKNKPVIAIGGIDAPRAARAIGLGCRGVAVVSAVWLAPSPADAVRYLRKAMEES